MKTIEERLQHNILILDGAMGTMIQQADLTAEDFGGEAYEGCNEYLVKTRPDVILDIHKAYIEAGADIIETNTFGATNIVLHDYELSHLDEELNERAALLAKQAVRECGKEVYVAGAMGPTTKAISVTGGVTFEELIEAYTRQARGLLRGGVDVLLVETSQDMRNVKAAYLGIQQAFTEVNQTVPLMISGTIEPMGTTLAGQTIEAFYLSVEHMKPLSVGLNCATGPEFMREHIRSLSDLSECYISCYPNAGLPDEDGHYHESPASLAEKVKRFAEEGWMNIVGGCCGTTPDHIRAIKAALKSLKPRKNHGRAGHGISGLEALQYDDSMRPLFVGERTNVIGSRKFKRLVAEGNFEEAAEVARAQVKKNAHIIDICMADPDRDEVEDMENFLAEVTKVLKVPIMIDSTDENVMAKALTYIQGKGVINSINLENGEERFEKVTPLIRKYGAAIVVGTIDEEGMAVSAERKLEIAKRSYKLLTKKYGIRPSDIIFDALVFPVGTGDEEYIGSAAATIEGIRLIKEALPECLTILGVSNISFGLPPAGREVLNSVFLYHATKAGLDYAIVNTEKLERYASIPEEEKELADALLFETMKETLEEFTNFYRSAKKKEAVVQEILTLDERLANYIVEGTKQGLQEDLSLALIEGRKPLDIINGPLMAGMDEVGRLFNNNELIVAEVLQSAESMKAAVAYLEPYMESSDSAKKGKVLLATVKGDVHDIGKNLVEIILSNNGYEIVNLGINVRSDRIVQEVQETKPDIIGLSGLLVKSAQQMVTTAEDLQAANIDIPIVVGGAALTRKFTDNRISPSYKGLVLYASDAMTGLDLINRLQKEEEREKMKQDKMERHLHVVKQEEKKVAVIPAVIEPLEPAKIMVPDSTKRVILRDIPISHLAPFLNRQMLIGHHLGLKGNVKKLLREGDKRAHELNNLIDELLQEGQSWLRPKAVYQFFPAQSEGQSIIIYDPEDHTRIIERFSFPRQGKAPYRTLGDYLRPAGDEMDYVAFLSVTVGQGVRDIAEEWKEKGDYLRSHAIQSLALELAEGLAEKTHMLIRDRFGIPDSPEMTMEERFRTKYQGIRVSFGYPACPELADQEKLFRLIQPEEIGISLTEGFMMEPEASVTAMVFAHPEARYFSVL
ncbi:methionine synthase [Bacillus pseudomycoides]|uniref:Methionine synthase n=1 Tax=Bacillus pseudomycoides TaxID=64104 RepID=A0AA91ZUH6_9BACI|nr:MULTISPECIES: methionine synthase [Bacillus]PEB53346.1 methionine synthase [Bacillus sp. AFS098217]PED83785.1 methionine synthase [Bacillus pseudomycoides]PEU14745.1 methionine synthase [Bacillus sp. AFS019443]PEU19503.1 methionine synthase [Bacillus sp. AFS014408]PFW64416.1 methionine synthase [Bacillus sp. AFS075034]